VLTLEQFRYAELVIGVLVLLLLWAGLIFPYLHRMVANRHVRSTTPRSEPLQLESQGQEP
jgi:hypothetical protein